MVEHFYALNTVNSVGRLVLKSLDGLVNGCQQSGWSAGAFYFVVNFANREMSFAVRELGELAVLQFAC